MVDMLNTEEETPNGVVVVFVVGTPVKAVTEDPN